MRTLKPREVTWWASGEPRSAQTPESLFEPQGHVAFCSRISIHVQETEVPGELLVTQGASRRPTDPTEAPAATCPGKPDPDRSRCCPPVPGSELGEQTPSGARESLHLPKRSSDGGEKVKGKQGPGTKAFMGPGWVRRDSRDEAAGTLVLQQGRGPGTRSPELGNDCMAEGVERAEAGRRTPVGAQASSMVLGKCGHHQLNRCARCSQGE